MPDNVGTFTVTKTADTNDGSCTVADCSLREASVAANAVVGPNTVSVPAGTYNLTLGILVFGSATNLDTTVMATGGTAIINQNSAGTVEAIDAGPAFGTPVSLSLQNVQVSGGDFGGVVAGADNGVTRSTLIINLSTISGNFNSHGTFGQGAGVFNGPGNLTITNSTISNNTASCAACGQGAGVYFQQPNVSQLGTLFVDNTVFSGNIAAIGDNFPAGAGIFVAVVAGSGSSLAIEDSTFTTNQATGGGDGAGIEMPATICLL